MSKILCVAEKPAIAKSVANHLSGGQVNTVRKRVPSPDMNDHLITSVEEHSR